MNILINIIGAALLGLLAVYIYRKKAQAKLLNNYFTSAVRVYALTNEEDARIAILTAAKVAAKKQRQAMVKSLKRIAAEMNKMSETDSNLKPFTDKFAEASIGLAEEISSREWTLNDINNQREELGKINSEYLVALDKADPAVFSKKHPQLFK